MQYYQLPLIFCPAKVNPFSLPAGSQGLLLRRAMEEKCCQLPSIMLPACR